MNDRLSYNDLYINYQELPKNAVTAVSPSKIYDKIRVYKGIL